MAFTITSPFGTAVYDELQPWANDDLALLMDAIGVMFDGTFTLASPTGNDGDPGYVPGWGTLFDVNKCPTADLPYLGQYVGVQIPVGTSDSAARALIRAESGFSRGTVASVNSAIQRNISTVWQPNTTYPAGVMVTYNAGAGDVFYLVPTGFTSGAVFVTPGTVTNWVPNPSAEYGMTNIVGGQSGVVTQDATHVRFGSQAVKLVTTAAGGNQAAEFTGITWTIGDTLNASVWVYGTAGDTVNLFLFEGVTAQITSTVLSVTGYNLLTVSATALATTTLGQLWVYNPAAVAKTWWVDGAMLARNAVLPATYVDGDSPGYYWEGTVGDSPSGPTLTVVDPTTQYVFLERTNAALTSDAYQMVVVVRPEQLTPTNNTTALLAAVNANKPAGVILNLIVTDSPRWSAATLAWNAVSGSVMWAAVAAGQV